MANSWRRLAFWSVLIGALIAGLAYAFRPQSVPVDLLVATRGPLVVTVDEEGETRVKDVYRLSAPVSGRALRIDAEVGDPVAANETVVARIEPIDPAFLDLRSEAQAQAAIDAAKAARALAAAELERAEAELEYASAEFQRARKLVRGETISVRNYDRAKLAFKTAQAAVATARASLRMRGSELERARAELLSPVTATTKRGTCECVSITSPVSGRILRILHKSEGVVEAGDPLVEIGNPSNLEIVTDLLSSDAVQVVPGQRVIIDDWGGAELLSGIVLRVEPTGFTKVSALGIEEQRVNIVVNFTGEAERWRGLGHGYRVETRVVLWESDSVLKLPLSALFRNGDDWSVFVEQEGRATRRTVSLGHLSGREAEITDGLREGEAVVVYPSDRVVEGARIVGRRDS